MLHRAVTAAVALTAVVLLGGCGAQRQQGIAPGEEPQPLSGTSTTFSVGNQRFALAVFPPPASMVLVRTGPVFVWVTPSPALHDLYVQDVVAGKPQATHVLDVNDSGTVDYTYSLRWRS